MNRREKERALFRDQVLDKAVGQGKILASSRENWARRYDRNPAGTEKLLGELAAAPALAAAVASSAPTGNPNRITDEEMRRMGFGHAVATETPGERDARLARWEGEWREEDREREEQIMRERMGFPS